MLEYWTVWYAQQAAQGQPVSFEGEDDHYDLDKIEAALAEMEDQWETIIDEQPR